MYAMEKMVRGGAICALALGALLQTFVAAATAEQPGRGFTFADRLRFSGREPPPFPSAPFRGRIPARRPVPRGTKFVVVPFFTGFQHHPPVVVTSPPSVTVIISVPPPAAPGPEKEPEPRLCPWVWTPETGKKCLEEVVSSQEKQGLVLRGSGQKEQ